MRQFLLLMTAAGLLVADVAPGLRRDYAARGHDLANRRLLDGADAGDIAMVRQALADGADFFAWDERRTSAVGFAIRDGNLPLLELLLSSNADPDLDSHGELSPLEQAARTNNAATVARLLQAGATRNRDKAVLSCVVSGRSEALRALLEGKPKAGLLRAAIESNLPNDRKHVMVRRLLEWGAPPDQSFHSMNLVGTRPIDLALQQQDAGMVDLLREFGAPYTVREAVVLSRTDKARRMIEQDPSIVTQRFLPYAYVESPDRYPTLLGLALRHGQRELARELIDAGAPIDGLEWYDETMLVQAVVGNDPEMIEELASRGLSVNSDDPWNAPLFHASWRGRTAAVAALIELGADVKQPGPLHRAAFHNFPQIARLLLDAGADPSQVDENGRTPREAAEQSKSLAVLSLLDEFEAKSRKD
jgi:ankyrin repeat protein